MHQCLGNLRNANGVSAAPLMLPADVSKPCDHPEFVALPGATPTSVARAISDSDAEENSSEDNIEANIKLPRLSDSLFAACFNLDCEIRAKKAGTSGSLTPLLTCIACIPLGFKIE
jgi:hypothetical protein